MDVGTAGIGISLMFLYRPLLVISKRRLSILPLVAFCKTSIPGYKKILLDP